MRNRHTELLSPMFLGMAIAAGIAGLLTIPQRVSAHPSPSPVANCVCTVGAGTCSARATNSCSPAGGGGCNDVTPNSCQTASGGQCQCALNSGGTACECQ